MLGQSWAHAVPPPPWELLPNLVLLPLLLQAELQVHRTLLLGSALCLLQGLTQHLEVCPHQLALAEEQARPAPVDHDTAGLQGLATAAAAGGAAEAVAAVAAAVQLAGAVAAAAAPAMAAAGPGPAAALVGAHDGCPAGLHVLVGLQEESLCLNHDEAWQEAAAMAVVAAVMARAPAPAAACLGPLGLKTAMPCRPVHGALPLAAVPGRLAAHGLAGLHGLHAPQLGSAHQCYWEQQHRLAHEVHAIPASAHQARYQVGPGE